MKHCFLGCFVLAFLMAGIGLQAMAEAPWANIGGNSARTYMSTWPGPGAEITLLAKRATSHDPSSDGLPFATVSEQGTVVAKTTMLFGYDSAGAELFTCDLGPNAAGGTQCGVMANGRIYAGAINTLYAFDLNGNEICQHPIGDPRGNYYLDLLGAGPLGQLVVPAQIGSARPSSCSMSLLSSVDPQGGLAWTTELEQLLSGLAVSADGKTVLEAERDPNNTCDQDVLCIGPGGAVLWSYPGWSAYPFPAIDDSRRLVILNGGQNQWPYQTEILALELDSGGVAWEYAPGGYWAVPRYWADPQDNAPQYDKLPAPMALDTQRGQYYAFWYSADMGPAPGVPGSSSYLLTALSADGELVWSKQWDSDRSKRYDRFREVTIDSKGLLYIFYSYTKFRQVAVQGCVCCVEVLSPEGELLAYKEYESPDASAERLWTGGQAVIGTDRRIYMFATDFEDPTVCSLYIFGPAGTELPADDQRPCILSAGYGFSRVTTDAGGTLTINAKVSHPLGASNIDAVEVRLYGVPTGLCLLAGKSEGEYSVSIDVPAGFVPAGQFLLELVARDKQGRTSDVWPYMTVAAE
ncbi:MAG: hypothetical protein JW759_00630 [Candidatus Coatesbacteria bacterium]|nr:hypothetical protein [Candidatus Coatesbacteria bacterium]